MPQMEGIEAVERIVQEHPEARVVMVSSVGYQDNILAALQKGARHFVQKPVKPEALYEILRYVLNDDGVPAAAGASTGELAMRMDLIQPFIGSLDAVLAEMMNAPATIADLTMEEEGYREEGLGRRRGLSKARSKDASFSTWNRGRRRKWPNAWLAEVNPSESIVRKPSASLPTWSSEMQSLS